MSGLNKAILVGHVGRDPEGRDLGSSAVVRFSLATSRRWTSKGGERQEKTEWHRIVVWGRLAELAREHVRKGMLVGVTGSIEYREWEDQGVKRTTTEIRANEVEFLSKAVERGETQRPKAENFEPRKQEAAHGWGPPEPGSDEIPF